MTNLRTELFSAGPFMPHGHCYLWQPGLVWLHLLSDSLIALAYYSIPLTLLYFVQKRKDLPFNGIFILFSAFILSCGTMHLMEVWTLWHPTYWVSGAIKAITAVISLYTAIVLVQLMPQALTLPSPTQLATINQTLQQQIEDRQQAEAQVRQLNQVLEAKVAQRTAELENSMTQVQDYAERMTLAMDAARMGSWDWDLKTQVLLWSPYHEMLFGYETGTPERTYEDWSRRLHPDDLAAAEAKIQASMSTGADFSADYRVVWTDGSIHWVASFGRFYFNPAGKPLRMMGMVQDISDRKQVEALFQLSEERLRLATEAADIGMWFWNLTTSELVWTERCKTLFGLDAQTEITYERFLAALHPDDRDRTQAAITRTIAEKVEYVIEYRSVWPDETVHWLIAKGRAFYDPQDNPIHMMGMVQDISDRKQAEVERLEHTHELAQVNKLLTQTMALVHQRNQELDQFAHIVSHDLKAPLRAIANLSTWIEEDLADLAPPEIQKNLTLLRSRVYRMESLITGLLAYARISYQDAPNETFALNDLLDEIIDSLEVPAGFTLQIPPDLPTLTTNRLLLNQVLTNLIGNAIKHHDRPVGQIQISAQVQAEPEAHGYEFIIADDGPGITSSDHQRIFDIFQTLVSRDQKESTGVGLAIVKKIIDRIGGQIHVSSELGKGTTFRLTWPTVQTDA